MISITEQQLQSCLPSNRSVSAWYPIVATTLTKYSITTLNRVAAFLAQTAHESMDWNILQENLNYSENGLLVTFGKYFNSTTAAQYARQPQKIANRVYANRMGNGPESSGDGWKYRGRGLIQTTGKSNYQSTGATMGQDLLNNPDLLMAHAGALESACVFWSKNNLNALADAGNIRSITIHINGGTLGLAERESNYARNLKVLQA
jgi:putative chitinase